MKVEKNIKKFFFIKSLFKIKKIKECDCETAGTVGNMGCNKNSGQCFTCKKHVTGEKCDKCKLGYFGLSYHNILGCTECACVMGNSYSSFCDSERGQCSCRPHILGRRCEFIEDGFYCAKIDHLILEAEQAQSLNYLSHNLTNYEHVEEGFLTGTGHVKVFEGEILKFKYYHDYDSGLYDLVLRYNLTHDLQNVTIRIGNMGADVTKPYHLNEYIKNSCKELKPEQSRFERALEIITKDTLGSIIYPKYCLEKFHFYEIEIEFNDHYNKAPNTVYNSAKEAPFVFVDSVDF